MRPDREDQDTDARILADGAIAIAHGRPSNAVPRQWGRTAEKADAESTKGKPGLTDALAEQLRQRSEGAWNAATAKMRTAWVAGRDANRRVTAMKHEPERRCR